MTICSSSAVPLLAVMAFQDTASIPKGFLLNSFMPALYGAWSKKEELIPAKEFLPQGETSILFVEGPRKVIFGGDNQFVFYLSLEEIRDAFAGDQFSVTPHCSFAIGSREFCQTFVDYSSYGHDHDGHLPWIDLLRQGLKGTAKDRVIFTDVESEEPGLVYTEFKPLFFHRKVA